MKTNNLVRKNKEQSLCLAKTNNLFIKQNYEQSGNSTKKINFVKMHGLGNDFVVLDSYYNPDLYSDARCNLTTSEIQLICHRNFGIGCDQLLLIEPSTNKLADFDYRIYNQDGSPATHCGNGARCITLYLLNRDNNKKQKTVLNIAGHLIYGSKVENNLIMVNMGNPSFNPEDVGYIGITNEKNYYSFLNSAKSISDLQNLVSNFNTLNDKKQNTINFAVCSVGNPHAIIELDDVRKLEDDLTLTTISQTLQNSGQFKSGVNVNFYTIDNEKIHLRTFERGCGFTLACGTGACATASYAIWHNQVTSPVTVYMPGGSVEIHWDKHSQLQMVGSATHVFSGKMLL
jgi:diaminopimelate epimerase